MYRGVIKYSSVGPRSLNTKDFDSTNGNKFYSYFIFCNVPKFSDRQA